VVVALGSVRLAAGFAAHSGWATAVVAGLVEGHLHVHDRRRVELVSADLPRQAYHAAADLPAEEAIDVVTAVDRSIAEHARAALAVVRAAVGEAPEKDVSLVAVGVVGLAREIPDVPTVLASHALMHASEGEQYRRGLAEAATRLGLPVCRTHPKQVEADMAGAVGWSPSRLADEHARIRSTLGPPWQKDHKEATAAALVALTGAARLDRA
jgi:hypothetical protein